MNAKKQLVFATANPHKVSEIADLAGDRFTILGLTDIGCREDVPETSDTIAGNALQKARYVHTHYGVDCFAEDTGLEVDALGGEPGVYSARYAGPARDPAANMALLLRRLGENPDRRARFRTVIALILAGQEHLFEGVAEGHISREPIGQEGFGYDPIFIPEGHERSFAQMSRAEKNAMSHRGRAMRKFLEFLLP